MTLCALWGWWGMLYPEFTLTEDTYCVVYEKDAGQSKSTGSASTSSTILENGKTEGGESAGGQNVVFAADAGISEESPRELYKRLLQAPKGQVRFRSKLLLQLQKWME